MYQSRDGAAPPVSVVKTIVSLFWTEAASHLSVSVTDVDTKRPLPLKALNRHGTDICESAFMVLFRSCLVYPVSLEVVSY